MSRLHANLFVTFINSHFKLFVLGCLSFCSFISTVRCSGPVECRSNPSQSTLHLQQHGATSSHRWFVSLIIPELQKCKFLFCFWQLWLLLGDHCYCCWLQSFRNFPTGPSCLPAVVGTRSKTNAILLHRPWPHSQMSLLITSSNMASFDRTISGGNFKNQEDKMQFHRTDCDLIHKCHNWSLEIIESFLLINILPRSNFACHSVHCTLSKERRIYWFGFSIASFPSAQNMMSELGQTCNGQIFLAMEWNNMGKMRQPLSSVIFQLLVTAMVVSGFKNRVADGHGSHIFSD